MASITIGKSFFRGEVRGYRDPASALWRELIQNSVDNGAAKIEVTTGRIEGDKDAVRVTFSDDGNGMSREVLEDVYFRLGETTKGGGDDIGGFGRARLLTCFAQDAYTIRTQNLMVTGSGSEYDIHTTSDWHAGCEFSIHVHLPTMKSTPYYWEQEPDIRLLEALSLYLAKCQFEKVGRGGVKEKRGTRLLGNHKAVEVSVNGVVFTDYMTRGAKRRDLSFGTVHVVGKSKRHGGNVCVRVRGALMFKKTLYDSSAVVVVEIDPTKSREVLVSNRDSLVSKYDEELEELVQSLAINNLSGLNKAKSHTVIATGGYRACVKRDLSSGRRKKTAGVLVGNVEMPGGEFSPPKDFEKLSTAWQNRVYDATSITSMDNATQTHYGPTSGCVYTMGEDGAACGVDKDDHGSSHEAVDSLTRGMYFVLDSAEPKVCAAARKWGVPYLAAKGPGGNCSGCIDCLTYLDLFLIFWRCFGFMSRHVCVCDQLPSREGEGS